MTYVVNLYHLGQSVYLLEQLSCVLLVSSPSGLEGTSIAPKQLKNLRYRARECPRGGRVVRSGSE